MLPYPGGYNGLVVLWNPVERLDLSKWVTSMLCDMSCWMLGMSGAVGYMLTTAVSLPRLYNPDKASHEQVINYTSYAAAPVPWMLRESNTMAIFRYILTGITRNVTGFMAQRQ